MTATVTERPSAAPAVPPTLRRIVTPWNAAVALLAAGSATIGLLALAGGARSEYYASIALSMSKTWSNFLFGAMDPGGTVSLDKIPGSYWIPALFVKVLGFSTWAVDAPNAIATVVAVILVAVTARRILGSTAGIVAGLATATTPVLAAVARTNQPQSFFVLSLALVAWATTKAVQRGSLRWLMIAGICIAVAFHTYMLEAWAVWPALAVAYLCTAQPWLRKVGHLLVAGVTSLVLSLSWILVVTLTPAIARPWVGGSNGNSAWEMVFGYNGLGRFGAATASADYRSFTPSFSGDPGVWRLFNTEVAGQIGWLLPTAAVAVAILLILKVSRPVTIFLATWFATMVVMFSVVAGMHQFYTSALAVPVALLVGCAFAAARSAEIRWAQVALVITAAVTAIGITRYDSSYLPWAVVAQVVAAGTAVLLIALGRRRAALARSPLVALVAAAGMLLTPAAWAVDVVNHPNSINPVAGDGSAANAGGAPTAGAGRAGAGDGGRAFARGGFPGGPPTGGIGAAAFGGGAPGAGFGGGAGGSVDSAVLAYVQANRGGARYLLATFGAQAASFYITATDGDNVLPVGGFGSADPTPTLAAFTDLVGTGELRFVLVGRTGGGGPTGGVGPAGGIGTQGGTGPTSATTGSTATAIQAWVSTNCTAVQGVSGLYDCAG